MEQLDTQFHGRNVEGSILECLMILALLELPMGIH